MASKNDRNSMDTMNGMNNGPVFAPGQERQRVPLPSELIQGESKTRKPRKDFDAAFALSDDIEQVTMGQASQLYREEGVHLRKKIGLCAVVFVVLFFFSMCVQSASGWGFTSPLIMLDGIAEHFRVLFRDLVGAGGQLTYAQMVEQHPGYYQAENRFVYSMIFAICGVMLAVAGSLFQMVFKNPIAAPTMLGVSNGVQLGLLVFVLIFTYRVTYLMDLRFVFSFSGAVIVLLLVLGLTRLICGKGQSFSIFQLLMVGSLFSQVCGGVVQAITDTYMDEDLYALYTTVSEAMNVSFSTVGLVVIIGIFIVTVIPVFFMRYAMNTISYSDLEAKVIGLDTSKIKVFALVMGTLMCVAVQSCIGTVAMIALVIPFISRAVFGTEFKHQFWGDVLLGAIVLLLCNDLVLLFPFQGMELPLGTVVSFVTLPFYVWIIASRQKGWK